MNDKEVVKLKDWCANLFKQNDLALDIFDINQHIDFKLNFSENQTILREKLKVFFNQYAMKNIINLAKKDIDKSEQNSYQIQQVIDTEIKERLEQEIAKITKDSKELENLYRYPIQYIEMVASGKARGLLLYGESSLGKSYRVKEVLKRLGKKDYIFISGHITPMRFYAKLYQAREDLIVFDDVNILDNLIILNMIKACLNENSGNVVEYHTTKKMNIPSSFIFNGQVIMLLNDIPKRDEHLKAIESRVLKHHLTFTREEILKIIFEIATKKEVDGVSLAERLEIARWIKDNTNKATINLNIRLYLQAIDFYKWNKEQWKELTSNQIQNNEQVSLILQNCSDEEWIEKTGMSIKTKQRIRAGLGLTRGYKR